MAQREMSQTTRAQEGAQVLPQKAERKKLTKRAFEAFLRSDRGHRVMHGFIDRVFEHGSTRLFEWEGLENLDRLKDHIHRGDKVFVAPNHTSHADAAPVTKLLTDIRDLVPGAIDEIVYTMAGSMKEQQGLLIATMFNEGVEPYFKKVGITPDFVVSNNDVEERGMTKPENNGDLTREALRNPRIVSAVHLEGRTKGGKTDTKAGEYFGLQPFDSGARVMLRDLRRSGAPVVVLPVMVEGANKILVPESKSFTLSSMETLIGMLMYGEGTRLGAVLDALSKAWLGYDAKYVKPGMVKIGEPTMIQDLSPNGRDTARGVETLLAQLASPAYRGKHGRQVLGIE